jgi:hypothetical protein
MDLKLGYAAAALASALAFAAACAVGVAWSLLAEGRLPRVELDYMPHVRELLAAGRTDEAVAELRMAAAVDVGNGAAADLLAHIASETGDAQMRVQALRRRLQGEGGSAGLHLALARALLADVAQRPEEGSRSARIERAVRNAELAVQFDPGSAEAHRVLSDALAQQGDSARARAEGDAAQRLASGAPAGAQP